MAGFYQWETEPLKIRVRYKDGQGNPLEGYRLIVVSLDQGVGRGLYHGDYFFEEGSPDVDVAEQTINLYLDQEESGKYAAGPTDVQVNILYSDRERDVTVEGEIEVWKNLYPKEME